MRKIKITYEIVTPESAEHGDAEERGWIDEEGEVIEPDKWDLEDGLTHVDLAVAFIENEGHEGGIEVSSSPPGPHDWVTGYKYNEDYSTGGIENRSYHFEGFTDAEMMEIFERLDN